MVSKSELRRYERMERDRQRQRRLADDQAKGLVADSDEVRARLVARMHAGDLTLEQVQAELKRIQREAKKAGRPVRADYFKKR
jgi:hypothetical protein